jgi:hypothetical protein
MEQVSDIEQVEIAMVREVEKAPMCTASRHTREIRQTNGSTSSWGGAGLGQPVGIGG